METEYTESLILELDPATAVARVLYPAPDTPVVGVTQQEPAGRDTAPVLMPQ